MNELSEVQCPNCGGKIMIDATKLIHGAEFSCSNHRCNASISMCQTSYQVANSAMREFEQVKQSQLSVS